MLKRNLQIGKELNYTSGVGGLGFFSPHHFKKEFFLSNINFISVPINSGDMNIFTEETLVFLATLKDIDFLDLYLNTYGYFNEKQWRIFKEGVMNDMETHVRLVNYVKTETDKIPISHIIPLLRDMVLMCHVPTNYLFRLLNSNSEFRAELKNHPHIIQYLSQCNRNQHYIWGNALPAPADQNDVTTDILLRPMRGFHV